MENDPTPAKFWKPQMGHYVVYRNFKCGMYGIYGHYVVGIKNECGMYGIGKGGKGGTVMDTFSIQ